MKKRLWSLLLCLVLVCSSMAGCGDKESNDEANASANAKAETMVASQFKDFAGKITDALRKAKDNTGAGMQSGVDMELNVELGKEIQKSADLEGLDKIGLLLYMDMKNSMEMRMTGKLKMNEKNVLSMDLITDSENAYFNLPDYSKNYAGISIQDALGMTSGDLSGLMSEAAEGMPTTDDMIQLWTDFSNDFIDCFEYQETVKKITIGEGDYKIKADKYVTKAKVEDIQKVLTQLVEELKKYPALEITDTNIDMANLDEMTVSYFQNDSDEFAWKLDAKAGNDTSSIVLISAKKGFRFYVIDEDQNEQVLLYSVKESEKKGQIVLCTDDGNYTLNYDNYSKDHVDLSAEIEGATITASIDAKNDDYTIEFSIVSLGTKVSGTFEIGYREMKVTATVSMAGMEIGTLTLETSGRSFKDYDTPSGSVDLNTWSAGLNQDKLSKDLQKLIQDFPFISDLIQGAMPY